MWRLMRQQLYVMLHSRSCRILLAAALLLSVLLFFDNGDVVGSPRELEEKAEVLGFSGMLNLEMTPEAESVEEVMAILRSRQVIAAPIVAAGGMLFLLFLLPGVTLSPALTKTLGIQRELSRFGRGKALFSRMLLSWLFCLLLSTIMYLAFLGHYTDWRGAAPGLLGRNYLILELFVLAGVAYTYFMYVLLRKTWIAAPAMLLAEALLHRIIPGLYLFYPFVLIPYYNSFAFQNTDSLVAAGCPPEKLIAYCAVCAAYILLCPLLSLLLFRRRDFR